MKMKKKEVSALESSLVAPQNPKDFGEGKILNYKGGKMLIVSTATIETNPWTRKKK